MPFKFEFELEDDKAEFLISVLEKETNVRHAELFLNLMERSKTYIEDSKSDKNFSNIKEILETVMKGKTPL